MSEPTESPEQRRRRIREERLAASRKTSTLDGAYDQKLRTDVPLDTEFYRYRWVNDSPSSARVLEMKRRNWFVTEGQTEHFVGVDKSGQPIRAVLMEQLVEHAAEREAQKRAENDARMRPIVDNQLSAEEARKMQTAAGQSAAYLPREVTGAAPSQFSDYQP